MTHVGAPAANAYMQGSPSSATVLLVSGSADGLIDKLIYLEVMARSQRERVSGVAALRDRYAGDKQALDAVAANLAKRDADLAGKKKVIEKKIKELQKLRVGAYGAGGAATGALRTGPCPADYTNDAGGKAAAKACSLIGKPYIWAAAGPSGYNCSGLTLVAWTSAGVSLRHYTQWQWQDAEPVSRDELKPGDLVFYYSDLHHMGMYVYVRTAPLDHGPIAGYRRPA